MKYNNIFDLIKAEETNYSVPINIIDTYDWGMKDHISTTVLYKNSTYKSGKDDNKPFKNIIRPILNLAYRAEGFDVKDIVLFINDTYAYFKSFLVKKFHEKWARENDIDTFIDEMVESYVDFGGALVKDVNDIKPEVVPWQRVAFCDQTDILAGPIAEKHFYSPDQLKEMSKNGWKNIDEVITLSMKENDVKTTSPGQKVRTPGKYIEVYEIHGMFPRYWLNAEIVDGEVYAEDSKEMEYIRQLQIIAFYQSKDGKKGITLFKGKEAELPYKLILRDEIYGRGLGLGGAEELFEPQVWVNYDEIHKKNMLDAASKVLLQTSDPAFANRNKVQNMENLEITVTEDGKEIRQIPTTPVNLQLFENSTQSWEQHARQMGAATESIMGESPSAGTPFKLQELITAESHSLHEYRKGKLSTFLSEIYRDWVIPHLVREITQGDEFLATLDLEELQQIADALVTCESNKMIKEMILNGQPIYPDDVERHKQIVKESFMKGGNKRFLQILKGEMKGVELGVQVNIAGKQKDLAKMSDKLSNIMRFVFSTYNSQTGQFAVFDDPRMAKLFNQIIESSGLSPIDTYAPPKPPQPAQSPQPTQSPQRPQLIPAIA